MPDFSMPYSRVVFETLFGVGSFDMSRLHTLRLLNEGFICLQGDGKETTLHFLKDAGMTAACVARRSKRCVANMLAYLKSKHAERWGHWDAGRLGWHSDFDVEAVALPEAEPTLVAVVKAQPDIAPSSSICRLEEIMERIREGSQGSAESAVEQLRSLSFHTHQIGFSHLLPGSKAQFAEVETPFQPQLSAALSSLGVRQLFEHQVRGINALARGQHLVLTTSTGSGKSMVYNCAVVDTMLQTPNSKALYMFPTKALAQDQLLGLRRLLSALPNANLSANTYDGDTPVTLRAKLREESSILLTNPDTLHLSMLPDHPRWREFISNLKFVVIDEAHAYTGAFGAHVAFVLRRLIRVCMSHGVSPRLVCCSASVSNPLRLLGDLVPLTCLGADNVTVVDQDTSAQGNRLLVVWNPLNDESFPSLAETATTEFFSSKSPSKFGQNGHPCREPLLQSLKRKRRALTALSEDDKVDKSIPAFLNGCEDKVVSFKEEGVDWPLSRRRKNTELSIDYIPRFAEEEAVFVRESDSLRSTGLFDAAAMLVHFIRAGVRCLLFCPCRSLVETVHNRALTLAAEMGVPRSLIAGYRGGYSAEDRRSIESSMAKGLIQGIIATNALELGVDIGSLSATIHLGYGNSTSFWQQAGRAGRGGAAALTVLICLSSPADQYVGKNPHELLRCRRDHYISTANPHIIRAHLHCAAFELPLNHDFGKFSDAELWGTAYETNLQALVAENIFHLSGTRVRCFGKSPAKTVGIRQMESDSFVLVDNFGKQLDSMDRWRAFKTVHEGSVVVLQGQHYLVSRLDLETKIAYCSAWRPSYKTVTRCRISLNISKVLETRGCASVGLVTVQISGWHYKKVRGTEILSEHDCFLPDVLTVTGAICIDVSDAIKVRPICYVINGYSRLEQASG